MRSINRRQALSGAAVLGAGALLTPGTASAATAAASAHPAASAASGASGASASRAESGLSGRGPRVAEETRSLDELYQAAKAEGGELVVYAGGDIASQQAGVVAAFGQQFPDIKLTMVVDYSKFHDVRIDNQIANGKLVPDVTHLQTLQDFTRWKQQGRLLNYKPAGFSKVHDAFKDPDGAWVAIAVIGFSFMYNSARITGVGPQNPEQLVDARWKGAIASSYPNDDDAVLYLYSLYAQTYGWDWIAKLAGQQMQFARGSNSPGVALSSGTKSVGIASSGSLLPSSTNPVRWVVADDHPFMAWGQRAAIFKQAAHPAAAKLYLNWQLSEATQQKSFNGWSVRTDVAVPGNLPPIWTYKNAHLDGFAQFMADRATAERFRQTFTLYFGEVQGAPSPGWLGLYPGS